MNKYIWQLTAAAILISKRWDILKSNRFATEVLNLKLQGASFGSLCGDREET